jgi:DNA transposition AAA+ family ATPase
MSTTRKAGTAAGDDAHAAHGAGNPAPEAGMSRDTINIPDNVLQAGCIGYTEDERDDIQWMFTFARTELGGSRDRMCEVFDLDWTTIVRVAQGKYPTSIANIIARIRDVRRRAQESGPRGFVETVVTRRVFEVLDYALAGDLEGGRIVMISGSSRRGKTEAAKEWCRQNNHGRSVYVDCPVNGGLRALMQEIADKVGVNGARKTADLQERVVKSFHPRRILIVDEVLRVLPTRRSDRRPVELEFIRRLHDVTRCAVALIATPVFEHEMQTGWLRTYLEQLLGRIADPVSIPERVYLSEARDICASFNARPSEALVGLSHRIVNEPGKYGVLFELLRQAAGAAKRRGEALTEAHLAAAYRRRKERTKWPEEE